MSTHGARSAELIELQKRQRLRVLADDWPTTALSFEDHGLLLFSLAASYVQLPLPNTRRDCEGTA